MSDRDHQSIKKWLIPLNPEQSAWDTERSASRAGECRCPLPRRRSASLLSYAATAAPRETSQRISQDSAEPVLQLQSLHYRTREEKRTIFVLTTRENNTGVQHRV
jgi:hypothetical protein